MMCTLHLILLGWPCRGGCNAQGKQYACWWHDEEGRKVWKSWRVETTYRDLGADGREVLIWIWGLDQPGSEQGAVAGS